MTKFSVCHGMKPCPGSYSFVFVTKIVALWNAQISGQNRCRSISTTSVLISFGKGKLTFKTQETSAMFKWSRFIIIVKL